MVFRKGRKGITNTGNTIKYTDISTTLKEGAVLKKQLLNNNFFHHEREEAAQDFIKYCDDGGLESRFSVTFHSDYFLYSLNKRKRWMLVDMLKNVVENEELAEENYRVVLYERIPPHYDKRTWPDCMGYHDSKLTDHRNNNDATTCNSSDKHKYPNDKFSFLTDLRLSGHPKVAPKKPQRKKKFHNQHFRGVQRNQRIARSVSPDSSIRCIDGEPEDEEHNVPEIRYEVTYPRKPTAGSTLHMARYNSRYSDFGRYRLTRPVMFHRRYFLDVKHSRSKVKGRQSKPWADEYYRGACRKYLDECIEDRHHDICCENAAVAEEEDDAEYHSTYSIRNDNYSINLSDLLRVKHINQRKTSKNKTKSQHIHPNVAMATDTSYYGKDRVIYSENMDHSSVSHDAIGHDEEPGDEKINITSDKYGNGTGNEEMELDKTYINCHICHNSIQEYLKKIENTRYVQTSVCKPARFVINLPRDTTFMNHSNSYSVSLLVWERFGFCSGSQSKNYWIRVQEGSDKSKDINSILRDVVSTEFSHVFHIEELLSLVEKISADQLCLTSNESDIMKTKWLSIAKLENDLDVVSRLIRESQIGVKSVEQAHMEIADNEEDIFEDCSTFEVLSMDEIYQNILVISDFCDICVSPISDVAMEMTTLLPCQHAFCNQCWVSYITERIKQGDECVLCLGYECKQIVDEVTVMSLISYAMYDRWKKRRQENLVEKSGKWKWCPNNSCKYVAKLNTEDTNRLCNSNLVRCKCSTRWCFDCQQTYHWPSTCDQSKTYRKMLEQNGDESGGPSPTSVTYFVHVKKCPKCRHPMEKNGGCSHMTCRCKHHFCWECLGDWYAHTGNMLQCVGGSKAEITMELDNNIMYPLPVKFYKTSVAHRRKWITLRKGLIKSYTNQEKVKFIRSRRKKGKKVDVVNSYLPKEKLIHYFITLKQTHQILENVMVVLSHLTRKTRDKYMERLLAQTEFCLNRQQEILDKTKLSQNEMTRIDNLHRSTWKCLQILSWRIPLLQATVSKSTEQKILGKPVSTFESFK